MADALASDDIRARMDRMYGPQQLVYDLTRRHYLLGRDRLIRELDAKPGHSVLDVGCGTGRNLALIARRYPGARLFGLDAAAPMLATAGRKVPGAVFARGVAEELAPGRPFDAGHGFDHVVISYCLSMVDDPAAAVRAAARSLAPEGTLHVVDFGDMGGAPAPFRRAMTAWLARFRVRHRPEVEATMRELAAAGGGRFARVDLARGYACLLRLARGRR